MNELAAPSSHLISSSGRPIPLQGVAVTGRVYGAHARLVLRQRYRNDETRPVEAIYTFPVPSDAALVGFAMEAAGRRVEAEVKEREEAFRVYDGAIAAGHGAALLDQERRNVLTASVGNLLPGEETVVEVVYVQALRADEGALRLVIPTLVAPRYIPGAPAGDRTGHGAAGPTDRVPDADRISPGIGAVKYGLAIDLVFDLGRAVTLESPSHAIAVAPDGGGRARVTLEQPGVALDRDLVITAAGAPGVAAGVVAARARGGEGTFALTVVPDLFDGSRRAAGRDVVFLIDVSGSMDGSSIEEARSAMRLCLRHLAEGDRFQIIAFSDTHRSFEPGLVPFTQKTLEAADRWVAALDANGGTEMLEPLLEAARVLANAKERDAIIVLLTDGQVGNEAEIVEQVTAAAGRARVYTFGIGTNVSDLLLGDLARRTRGAMEQIHPGERIDEKVTAQFARATAARIEAPRLRFEGVDAGELAPSELGDLVDGEPWVVYGRYAEPGMGKAEIRGTLRGEPFYLEVPLELPVEADREGLAAFWATARVRDLEAAEPRLEGRRREANRERIVALGVEHRVATKYTSFVLVEKRTGDRRAHELPEARPVPVHAPAGWAMFEGGADEDEVASMRGGVGAKLKKRGARPLARLAKTAALEERLFASVFDETADDAIDALFDEEVGEMPPMAKSAATGAPPPMETEPAPAEGGDPIARLFGRQLASGLWEGDDGADRGRLVATARALEEAAEAKVDSAHPTYGAQVRKAIEAVCALAREVLDAGREGELGADLIAVLTAASKVAAGRRLRDEVQAILSRMGR